MWVIAFHSFVVHVIFVYRDLQGEDDTHTLSNCNVNVVPCIIVVPAYFLHVSGIWTALLVNQVAHLQEFFMGTKNLW